MGLEVVKIKDVAEHLRFAGSLTTRVQLEYAAKHFRDKPVLFAAINSRNLEYPLSRRHPEEAAVHLYFDSAVDRYSEMVRQHMDSKYRCHVADRAAHSALGWSGNQRLGDIVFYSTLDTSTLAQVPVDLKLGEIDVEFIFRKSAQEAANEIVGAVVSAAKPQVST